MPQQGQIIPEWLHPHTETYINDNSVFQDVAAPTVDGIQGIFVFTSGKGRDNKLINKDSRTNYTDEFGKPNYKLFGQPGFMPYNFLSSGKARAWCMRIMPPDATYSNSVVLAKVKVDHVTGSTPLTRLLVRFEIVNISSISDSGELLALAELLKVTDPDADGFLTYPLFVVNSLGRGVYGDSFRYRISTAVQADKENAFKNYRFEVYELENTLNRKEVFEASIGTDAIIGVQSIFVEDVINDTETGSTRINVMTIQESFISIFNMYTTSVDPATTLTLDTFDFLYGHTKDGAALTGIAYDTANANYVALDSPSAIPLSGGNDGAFTYSPNTLANRDTAINTEYQKAFRGDTDRTILSKRRAPAQFIFDAAYDASVKTELINLIIARYDAYGFVDAGILNTITDALAWGDSMKGFADRIFSKEFQNYTTRDPFTGKLITVTPTYLYASQLPIHFANVGNHIPFTGETYAPLTGHIKNSMIPVIDADDGDNQEKLYLLHLNYFQTIKENLYVRGTQSTSQSFFSDLSEENNMYVLLELKRLIENMVSGLTYQFADQAERNRFKETAQRLINPYIGIKISSGSVDFQMSAWEQERSILHCYLGVTFRTIDKRGIIEIDVNKRV